MNGTFPPSTAERLLRATIRDAEWRDAVSGDLREEFAALARTSGAATARRWYWRQTLPLALRFVAGRIVPALTPSRRRRLAVAELEATSALGAGWSREVRHAWRALLQRPALSAVIVLTLGVVLAANAVIFTLADALYLRPFRFPDVNRLVMIASDKIAETPFLDKESVTPADFRDWTTAVTTVQGLAAAAWWDPNFSGVDIPEQVPGFLVSPGFFELLGARPYLGRTFTAEDGVFEAHRKAVLSYKFWQRQFAGAPSVLGTTIRLDGESYEVVGVMPPRFTIPMGADVWAPLAFDAAGWAERKRGTLMTFGRLSPGQTIASAQGELQAIVAQQAAAHPDTNKSRPVTVVSFTRGLGDELVGPIVGIWQAAALVLLLIGCANVANLLLARGTERQPELAVRLALGASRVRLVGQLLIEGLCLSVLGVVLGIGLTAAAMVSSRTFIPPDIVRFVPGMDFLRVDAMTFAVMALLGVLATMAFSLLPALQSSRTAGEASALAAQRVSTAPAGRQWTRSLLAGAQVAFTVALVVAASLIVRGVDRVTNGRLGFDKHGVLAARMALAPRPYQDAEKRRQFVQSLIDRLRAAPAVSAVAVSSSLPFTGISAIRPFLAEGRDVEPTARRQVPMERVTPDYLKVMRMTLVGGRELRESDRADAPAVALVSRLIAEREWPGQDAVGRRFQFGDDPGWIQVVGIVEDVTHDPIVSARGMIYRPYAQDPTFSFSLVTRTAGDPLAITRDVRGAVRALDPDQPIQQMLSMPDLNAQRLAGIDYFAKVLTVMSGVALILALTGVYSLVAYLAARRSREIGVRIALGATRRQVTWLSTTRAARIAAGGVVVGAVLAFAVSRLMQTALVGFVSASPVAIGLAVAVLAAMTIAAGYLPARRAAGQDPWQALRTE